LGINRVGKISEMAINIKRKKCKNLKILAFLSFLY
jgi:hypothetical protein